MPTPHLIISDELNSLEKPPKEFDVLSKLSHAVFFIPLTINQNELESIDPKVKMNTEIVKIKLLQDYFKKKEELQQLEKLFFEKFSIDNWVNYFLKLQRLIMADMERQRDSFTVKLDPITEEDINFYATIESSEADVGEYSDFFEIRKRPIIRLSYDEYGVLYLPFLYDKLYKSVYFELSKICTDNKDKLGKIGKDFQSNFGKDFFEGILCKGIVERTYKGKRFFNCLDEEKINGLTDYYVRNDKKIFLFEFKNSTIPKGVKCSSDFDLIEKSLLEKFDGYSDSKGRINKKAIMQLVNCIYEIFRDTPINDSKFSFKSIDTFLEKKKPIIYPIVVVQDYCLDAHGINYYLNSIFKKRLAENGLDREYNQQRIKNLTIIHIDHLIYLSDALRQNTIRLDDLINEYHRSTNKGKFGNPISFGSFLPMYLNRNKNFDTKPDTWVAYLQEFIKN